MNFKQLLLAGTSLALVSWGPSVSAQEVDDAFRDQCFSAGFPSVEECIAAQGGGAPAGEAPIPEQLPEPAFEQAPIEQAPEVFAPEPVPAPEVFAPPPVEEPVFAPESEPVYEQPAQQPEPVYEPEPIPEPVYEQPVPEVLPEPVYEQPAPEPEPFFEQPAPVQEPVFEQPQVIQAPEPVIEQVPESRQEETVYEPEPENVLPFPEPETVFEQPVPEVTEQPVIEPVPEVPQPVAPEQLQPETQVIQPEPEVAPPAEATPDLAGLTSQVLAYNSAVASIVAGGDDASARAAMAQAEAGIASSCSAIGFSDIAGCLAASGLQLDVAPSAVETPVEPVAPVPGEEVPLAVEPVFEPAPVEGETTAPITPADPAVQEPATPEAAAAVEVLPEGAPPEEAAPLLDSVKDQQGSDSTIAPAAPPENIPPVIAVDPATPVPENDAQAQASAGIDLGSVTSVVVEPGTALAAAPVFQTPQAITVINQTNVNVTNVNININNGIIYQYNGETQIRNPGRDRDRLVRDGDSVFYEELPFGRIRETVTRRDGSRVVTVRNRNGDVLRRSRISPDNQEYILAYFNDAYDNDLVEFRDPAYGLPPLRLTISAGDYVLDTRLADPVRIEAFFSQPPVDQVYRLYSIDEVKRSARIRDTVRRVEVGDLTFTTGTASVSRDQVEVLTGLATAIKATLARNPGETFLIEGHTDAVGSDLSNLELSDARAAAVANILTQFYDIPPENLATQGYGERYLKVNTAGPSEVNRRVTVRRITPLVAPVAQN